jgi:hypothetical protein
LSKCLYIFSNFGTERNVPIYLLTQDETCFLNFIFVWNQNVKAIDWSIVYNYDGCKAHIILICSVLLCVNMKFITLPLSMYLHLTAVISNPASGVVIFHMRKIPHLVYGRSLILLRFPFVSDITHVRNNPRLK